MWSNQRPFAVGRFCNGVGLAFSRPDGGNSRSGSEQELIDVESPHIASIGHGDDVP